MSSKQGTIIVGVDGSEASKRALQWAAQQAAAERRELTLVHTVKAVAPPSMDAKVVNASRAQEALQAAGRKVLDAARIEAARWAPGLDVTDVLGVTDARELLLQMSEGADMLVVGSHGRGRVRSALLGSVSVALVRRAHCPVVVVRPGNAGTVRNGIVVGVDALPESQPVLEFAYREASVRDLPLTVLHSGWSILAGTPEAAAYMVAETNEARELERLALAEAMAGMAEKYPDVNVTTRLVQGPPQDALVRLGERMNLIVVGSHQARGVERAIFGSVSVGVVEHASCPVAVVPVRS
jgi:nucleotide-binding universal stress UspA family protein